MSLGQEVPRFGQHVFYENFYCNHFSEILVGHGLDSAEQRRAGTVQVFPLALVWRGNLVLLDIRNRMGSEDLSKIFHIQSKPAIDLHQHFYNKTGTSHFKRLKPCCQAQLAGWMARATFASSSSSDQYGETRNVRVFLYQVCVAWQNSSGIPSLKVT